MNLLLNYITVAANIAGDLLEPSWIPQGEEDQGAPGLASPVTRHGARKSYKILNLDLTAPLPTLLMLCNIFLYLK